jgi:DNA-binding NtrC family response regulator
MSNHNEKIVIIDDDVDLTYEFEKILSEVGYDVSVHSEPLFSRTTVQFVPDVILIDVWLQGEPAGLAEATAIRKQASLAQVPVILMSSDPNLADYTKSAQATTYLTKPIDPEKLILALDQALHH